MAASPDYPFRSASARSRYLDRYDARGATWPIASRTLTVETPYGPTFVRVSGPRDGPPVVLLPGLGATSLMWTANIAALSAEYTTYAVDNVYDNGRSFNTRPVRDAADFAQWLDALLTALDIRAPVQLVGASYGAWIATQFALRFPQRVRRLALLAPAGTVVPIGIGFILRAILCAIPARIFMRWLMYWLADDLVKQDRHLVDEMVEDGFIASRCFLPRRLVPPTLLTSEEWHSLKVPTLFLVGEHEKIYPATTAVEKLRTVAPHVETHIIPGAGHDLFIVQSNLVNQRLLSFFREKH